jgi:hypothetical protein
MMIPARAGDPHPPQLNVTFLAEPAPIVQDGSTRLYYEMVITNFTKDSYTLDAVEATSGVTKTKFDGQALERMILRLGTSDRPKGPVDRTIERGRAVIVFLELNLDKNNAQGTIEHSLRVLDEENQPHDIAIAPLTISTESPIVVAPPLRGEWIAGDAASNRQDAAHRRAVLIDKGHGWLAQRFAIDWVQYQTVDGKRTTWRGPEDR